MKLIISLAIIICTCSTSLINLPKQQYKPIKVQFPYNCDRDIGKSDADDPYTNCYDVTSTMNYDETKVETTYRDYVCCNFHEIDSDVPYSYKRCMSPYEREDEMHGFYIDDKDKTY